jgi:hypothetical protein
VLFEVNAFESSFVYYYALGSHPGQDPLEGIPIVQMSEINSVQLSIETN